jgi:hypothetical protein
MEFGDRLGSELSDEADCDLLDWDVRIVMSCLLARSLGEGRALTRWWW